MKKKLYVFLSFLLLVILVGSSYFCEAKEISPNEEVAANKSWSTPNSSSPEKIVANEVEVKKTPSGRCVCNYKRCFFDPYNFNCNPSQHDECSDNDYVYEQYTCKQGGCSDTDTCRNLLTGELQQCSTCPEGYGYEPKGSLSVPYEGDCHWYGTNGQCNFTLDCVKGCSNKEVEDCP